MEPNVIVLTGTITPRAPFTLHADASVRRAEYLASLQFYRQFAPVVFLENSGYALQQDEEFAALKDCELWEMPLSERPQRGKGYQEFEMLDGWLKRTPSPPEAFVKITGRYLYVNFGAVLRDCQREREVPLMIDMHPRSARALTSIFAVHTLFYQQALIALFRSCNDEQGEWIEHVLYRQLSSLPKHFTRAFAVEPRLCGRSGSTGQDLTVPPWKYWLKRSCRWMNVQIDARRLWYAR